MDAEATSPRSTLVTEEVLDVFDESCPDYPDWMTSTFEEWVRVIMYQSADFSIECLHMIDSCLRYDKSRWYILHIIYDIH